MPLSNARRLTTLIAAAAFGLSMTIVPVLAAGGSTPSEPSTPKGGTSGKSTHKKKRDRHSEQEQQQEHQQFVDGYHAARALVLDGKYSEAITAFRTLDHDDNPDVANYVGYAYRKLGDYDLAKVWYDRALAADPNHLRTWQYYGMWHVEQGNVLKAKDFLEKVRLLCGNDACKEYADLDAAIKGRSSY